MKKSLLESNARIFLAGGSGMVGSALKRLFKKRGFENVIAPSRATLDLLDQAAVFAYLKTCKPDLVIVAAAKVGGILANDRYKAQFLYENLSLATHLIHGAHLADINRLLFLGSSCIYPKMAPQPLVESYLLSGSLEPTNEAYALAKIAGVKMVEYYHRQYGRSYISAMPTNLYGPQDNYDLTNSHVVAALLRRLHEAKIKTLPEVVLWGSGNPLREFLYVDDLAEALFCLLQSYEEPTTINIGSDEELTIVALAQLVAKTVGYEGKISFDSTYPDGTLRKKLDSSRMRQLGWQPKMSLEQGLEIAYRDFCSRFGSYCI